MEVDCNLTFKHFLAGPSNQGALSLVKMLLQAEGVAGSLLIIGESGNGKTHLIKAACAETERRGVNTIYFSGYELFSLTGPEIRDLAERLKTCGVAALDDIHVLQPSVKKEEEFQILLYTIENWLERTNGKLIMGSPVPPESLNPYFSFVFTQGHALRVKIGAPDAELKRNILSTMAKEAGVLVEKEQAEKIISYRTTSTGFFISVLRNIFARIKNGGKITDGAINEVFGLFDVKVPDRKISLETIEKTVCEAYKIDPGMLKAKSRKAIFTRPRQIYCFLCRKHTDATMEEIGKTINRKHSSVLYEIDVINTRLKKGDVRVEHELELLEKKILTL